MASTDLRKRYSGLPPWLRAMVMLLLTLLGAGVLAALLTPDDLPEGTFMLGIAVVHLAFGFGHRDWWAATGALLWLPLGLIAFGGGNLLSRLAAAALVTIVLAILVATGVGLRKWLRQSARWRSSEERYHQDPGPLEALPTLAIGLGLAAAMWVADALTASPLIVLLVAVAGGLGVRGMGSGRDTEARGASIRAPPAWADQPWKQWVVLWALVCGVFGIYLLLNELAGLIGMTQDNPERGPTAGSTAVWSLALLLYALHATPHARHRTRA